MVRWRIWSLVDLLKRSTRAIRLWLIFFKDQKVWKIEDWRLKVEDRRLKIKDQRLKIERSNDKIPNPANWYNRVGNLIVSFLIKSIVFCDWKIWFDLEKDWLLLLIFWLSRLCILPMTPKNCGGGKLTKGL